MNRSGVGINGNTASSQLSMNCGGNNASGSDQYIACSATLNVDYTVVPVLAVSPSTAILSVSQPQQQFTASLSDNSSIAVSWQATAGTITSGGLYTAPPSISTITSPQAVTVTATSQDGSNRSASAAVTLMPPAWAQAGLQFYPITPCRIADTRNGNGFGGAFGPPSIAAGNSRSFPMLTGVPP